MATLAECDLDTYSRVAVPLILARFPDWESHANVSPRPDGAGSVVEFNVPCPSPAAEAGLWVSTADEELSVGFHTHHRHFTDYDDRTNLAQIEAGLEYAAAIVGDRIGVASYYRGSGFAGSRSFSLPHPERIPELFDGLELAPELAGAVGAKDQVTLRSWSGKFDRDE